MDSTKFENKFPYMWEIKRINNIEHLVVEAFGKLYTVELKELGDVERMEVAKGIVLRMVKADLQDLLNG